MFQLRSKTTRIFVLLAFALVLAAATYGFAAANTFSGGSTVGRMGEGSGAISGYDVTSVSFTLNSANPHQITAVALVLDNSATGVQVSLDGATWDTCSGSGVNWSCTLGSAVNVSAANSLDVYATDL